MTVFVSHHPFRACRLCLFRVGCGSKPPGFTLDHSLPTRRLMVVRIGAFRPFRGMGQHCCQLPDDRGIANAKAWGGEGGQSSTTRGVSDSANLLAQLERCDTIGLQVWPDVPFRFFSRPRKIFSNLCLCCLPMPVARRRQPHLRRAAACFPRESSPHPRCWATLYRNPTIGDTAKAHGWDARRATPRVSSRIQCVTLPAISWVRL